MAKRSKRRAVRQNKDQAGCMWGLISIFDFRHGRTTRRLLSADRRQMAKNTVGPAYPTTEISLLKNSQELHVRSESGGKSETPTFDLVKTSVKELMEEEMFSEQGSKNQKSSNEVELFDSERGGHVRDTEKIIKSSLNSHEVTDRKPDLEALMKELLLIHQKRNELQNDLDAGSKQTFSMVEEKLIAAVEVFMNEKSIDGLRENGKTHHSKDFIDAFQMLSSNKELFPKLLQDRNSLLLKHIQGSENAQLNEDRKSKSTVRSNQLENEPSIPGPEEPATRKHRNFFRRRSKSQESISLKANDDPHLSSRIVILKPGTPDNRIRMDNEIQSERSASQFSFMEIKRRLKHAMGKEQSKQGDGEKASSEGSSGWSSPNRNHFYTERFARISSGLKKGERVSKLKEPERKLADNLESGGADHMISNIYIEAKKHLSEMLSSGDEDAQLLMGSLPKTLGRILALPEYNSLTPGGSPKKENEHGIVTAQMSPCGNSQTVCESQHVSNDNPEEQLQVPDEVNDNPKVQVLDEVNHDNLVGDTPSSTGKEMSSEGAIEIRESPDVESQEKFDVLDISCEPCCSSNSIDDALQDEIAEVSAEVSCEPCCSSNSQECFKLDLPEENELSSSPTASPLGSSLARKTEELESSSSDRTGRPSPISVLEPLFSDDDISPASTFSRPVEAAIQPLRIQFEELVSPDDQEICIRNGSENEESAFEYVEAVLLASDLNWDEFEKRWLSSVQVLDPSLFDEVEIFSSRPCHDQRLLFDSTNKILKEVCDYYLGFFLELSFTKRNLQPVPKGMDLINEVWERIESHLRSQYPRSLDQLVKTDLGKSSTWMDLRPETRELVIEIEDSIFEDMIDDTLFSLVSEFVNDQIISD